MNLYISTENANSDFELLDFLHLLNEIIDIESSVFRVLSYEYNNVKGDWRKVRKELLDYLGNENSEGILISYQEFYVFASFIGQTIEGHFQLISKSREYTINFEVFDSIFWNLSTDNIEIFNLLTKNKKIEAML